jgi:magnesium-transporting ATPase (P-type)
MQRSHELSELYGSLALLIFAGCILIFVVALAFHMRGRWVSVPRQLMVLMLALFPFMLPVLAISYRFAAYQLQPDEAPGPLGEPEDMAALFLWLCFYIVLSVYVLTIVVYGPFRFYRWLRGRVPHQSNIDTSRAGTQV